MSEQQSPQLEKSLTNKHTVLVVEDDIFISDILGRKLGQIFRVLHAPNVALARNLLEKELVDVMCLDIDLPGDTNGLQFLQELRKKENFKNTPIMIVSNYAREEDIDRALKYGANDYLIKSSSFLDEVVEKAHRLVSAK